MATRNDASSMKMIRVDDDTHDRLKQHGKYGDSFDDIIKRLMDIVEGKSSSSKK
jgi:predicted CopG family antitoxin